MKVEMNKNKRIIISGGGTGGHIFPALSIANALKEIDPAIEILFVGALGKMEMDKVPAAGYKIIGLPIMGFQRKLTLKNFEVLVKLWISLLKARIVIKEFKPDVAVGVGGYASGPVLRIASKLRIPTLLQEQNSFAGVTNKLLAKKARKICVAYDGMEKYFPVNKILKTGNPVRQDLTNIADKRSDAQKYFGLNPNKKTLLILGGSLGARTINQSIMKNFDLLAKSGIQVIWQTGSIYIDQVRAFTKDKEMGFIQFHPFISRMDLAFAIANLTISRAGAGTISELCIVGQPAILVPSPNVAEDHQTHNAMALVNQNAALMVTDADAGDKLIQLAVETMKNQDSLKMLSENISKMALHHSAKIIAEEVLKLCDTQN
jgi:UDP-N-acetylglucosamine--N-acetylmuramyl-(pentapeptide) pyrophosphoryl-undecaprenol N-acetylglucosamine transferase